jgi:hypothetical protein
MAKKKPAKKAKKRSPKKKPAPKPDVNQIAARIVEETISKSS